MLKRLFFILLFPSVLLGQQTQPQPAAPTVVNYGWVPPSPEERALAQDNVYTQQLRELVKYNDDSDVLLYRFLYKALENGNLLTELEKRTGRVASMDQGSTGSCVSFGSTRALQITAACDIYIRKEQERFKHHFNPNANYGIIRSEHLGRWDGAVGAWAVEAFNKYGTLYQIKYGEHDISNASPQDARKWAAQGLPKELLEAAGDHKVIASALVKTPDEVKAALQNGYGVILCSGVGYNSTRDSLGYLRPETVWQHCMACIAWRNKTSGREGYLISNSWGGPEGTWVNGPIWPEDIVFGSFWITPENLQLHLKENDSYAIAGYEGFKRRPLKWDEIFKIGEEIEVENN